MVVMAGENRLKILTDAAGDVPINPLESAVDLANVSFHLFSRGKGFFENSRYEEAYILLTRYLSMFQGRFRSHPECSSLPENIRMEIQGNTSYAKKLHSRMQKILEQKFQEESHYRFMEHMHVSNESDSLQFQKELTDFQSPALMHLKTLMPLSRDPDELQRLDAWMLRIFTSSDASGDGILDEVETQKLLLNLNKNFSKVEASMLYQQHKKSFKQKEGIGLVEFASLFNAIIRYPMLEKIFYRNQDRNHMTAQGLRKFLSDQNDRFGALTDADLHKLMEQYELPVYAKQSKLSVNGFASMILSSEFNAFQPSHRQVYQDMTHPLPYYYVASSHNTYLSGNQVTSDSSVELYKSALLKGCRCVELDCWDGGGDDGPLIHHGGTLTSSILFSDVLTNGIKPYAFATSQYPLILSLENHCGELYQKNMARHLNNILGDLIYRADVNRLQKLPSPQDLKGKIIIKASKKLKLSDGLENLRPPVQASSYVEEDVDYDSDENQNSMIIKGIPATEEVPARVNLQAGPAKITMRPKPVAVKDGELNALVNICQAVKFKSLDVSKREGRCYFISSFVESKAKRLGDSNPLEFIKYNQKQLTRVYPMGTRVMSSNLDPTLFWKFGCQIVALNYQTKDKQNLVNRFFFSDNGNCGYILKPNLLTDPNSGFDPTKKQISQRPMTCRLTILGAMHLPNSGTDSPLSPSVQIEVIGFDHDRQTYSTFEVKHNGFNPVWDLTFSLRIHTPEYALLFFTVMDKSLAGLFNKGTGEIAYAGIPVAALSLGYRNVRLVNLDGDPLTPSVLIIHTEKVDEQ